MGQTTKKSDLFYYLVGLVNVTDPPLIESLMVADSIAFVADIPNDRDRVGDCEEIRLDAGFQSGPPSVLEVIVSLANRLNQLNYDYQNPDAISFWFDVLLNNLDFEQVINDPEFVFNTVNDRSYESNGNGGLFPLAYPEEDQRDVDLWNQMNQWIIEWAEI